LKDRCEVDKADGANNVGVTRSFIISRGFGVIGGDMRDEKD
jgi:hypothetical protein